MKKERKAPKNKKGFKISAVFVLVTSILLLTTGILIYTLASYNLSLSNVLGIEVSQQQIESKIISDKISEADKYLVSSPRPIAKLSLEGKLSNDPDRLKSVESLKDVQKVYTLGYAFSQTKDTKYSSKAYDFLNSWLTIYKASGNPIDETHLVPMIKGYSWVRGSLDAQTRSRVDNWLILIGLKELASKYNDVRDVNNWNSHRVQLITLIGMVTENTELFSKGVELYKKQIDQNLNADGTSHDFIERDAIHYHVFNLMPLVSLARETELKGIDLYSYTSPKGASIKKSMEFLKPYLTGEKTHLEFVNSKAAWDKTASASKTNKGYDVNNSLELLESYYFFDTSVLPIIQKIRNNFTSVPSFEVLLASRQSAQVSVFSNQVKTIEKK